MPDQTEEPEFAFPVIIAVPLGTLPAGYRLTIYRVNDGEAPTKLLTVLGVRLGLDPTGPVTADLLVAHDANDEPILVSDHRDLDQETLGYLTDGERKWITTLVVEIRPVTDGD